MLDPTHGTLMSELTSSGRGARALLSSALITDGDWHHVGFHLDETERMLTVDGIDVARDNQTKLGLGPLGLQIGAGQDLQEGQFWNGSIDDVRLYDRIVRPEGL